MNLENGYEYVYMPTNPMAKSNGCVFVHRLVMSEKIGRPLTKDEHVHHIDGNKLNNNIENLMLVTRSEHTKIEQALKGNFREDFYCSKCGIKTFEKTRTGLCYVCYCESTRLFNPTKEELEQLVWQMPTTKLAKLYGVSDSAIGNRCKILGILKPPRGYWKKVETGKI
jgi:hypothetical protein